MICPKCGSEYREGFYRCPDCNVTLVEGQARIDDSDESDDPEELIGVLETKNSDFIESVVEILENRRIPYLVQSGTAFETWNTGDNLTWHAILSVSRKFSEVVESIMKEVKATASQTSEPAPEDPT